MRGAWGRSVDQLGKSRRPISSVDQLGERLERCSKLLDEEFPEVLKKADPSVEMGNSTVEKVVTDKNTIVQITVHTKPKDAQERKSQPRYLEKKSEQKPLSRKPESPRRTKRIRQKETAVVEKENVQSDKSVRSVPDLVHELRDIIQSSGIKDVYELLKDIEDGSDRRKSAPPTVVPSYQKPTLETTLKEKGGNHAKGAKEAKEEDEKRLREEKDRKAENARLRSELSRYKKEYETSQANLRISKETSESLNGQVVELKQLISKLTGNNRNLVQLVSDRASQDERLVELENNNKTLSHQLEKEKSTIKCYETKFREQEEEIIRLKSLTVDIRAQLRHGLEGFDIPRPGSSLPQNLLNQTEDILGQTILNRPPNNKKRPSRPHSQSSDSAFDDPETRSLTKPVFTAPPPPREPPPAYREPLAAPPTNQEPPSSPPQNTQPITRQNNIPSNTGTPSTQPPPSGNSSIQTYRQGAGYPQQLVTQGFLQGGTRAPPPYYAHSPPTRQVSVESNIRPQEFRQPFLPSITPPLPTSILPSSNKTSTASKPSSVPSTRAASNVPTASNVLPATAREDILGDLALSASRQTSRNLFAPVSRSGSRSSTLINSMLQPELSSPSSLQAPGADAGGQRFTPDEPDSERFDPGVQGGVEPRRRQGFTPVPLNLEETASPDELDGSEGGLSKSTPATVIDRNQKLDASDGLGKKQSLEIKVQDFLDRLHQESLNYSLPQARSFQGASFHLSLSGGEENLDNISRDTTLTEGKFRRGLETSIEIIPQEFSVDQN